MSSPDVLPGTHEVEIAAGTARARIAPQDGGRLSSVTVDGSELLGGVGTGSIEHGSFVMAPWAGRIRDGRLTFEGRDYALPVHRVAPHAGHGTVIDQSWEVDEASPDRVRLSTRLGSDWPWPGRVVQDIRIHRHGMTFLAELHADETAFPGVIGWHPWFRTFVSQHGPAVLDFDAGAVLARDGHGIPDGARSAIGEGPWDDCFIDVTWPVAINWPGVVNLTVSSNANHLVIYNERAEAFCVEPQSGPPDGPNYAPDLVCPGEPLVREMSWQWRPAVAGVV